jgi:hypothetical protein
MLILSMSDTIEETTSQGSLTSYWETGILTIEVKLRNHREG